MLLQQKIAGLEKKLTHNGVSTKSGKAPQRLPEEHTNISENSRLEINLSKYELNHDIAQSQPTEVDTARMSQSDHITRNNLIVSSNLHSVRSNDHIIQTKKPRRSESVTVKTIRSNLPRISNDVNRSRKLNSGTKSIRSQLSSHRSVDVDNRVKNTLIKNKNKELDSSRETKNSKRYMQPTDSSVKKLNKASSKIFQKVKVPTNYGSRNCLELRNFSKHPFALVMLFQSYKYHRDSMILDPENKVLKLIYYVFAPYILSMLIIMKSYVDNNQKTQCSNKKGKVIHVKL